MFASGGRETATATGDFLFSRAFALLAAQRRRRAGAGAVGRLPGARARRARAAPGRLRLDVDVERYLLRCELKTASLFAAACRLGGARGRPQPRRRSTALERLRAPGRRRLPDARRRARRERPGGAHRQAPRHRPARRHGDAAADPRARADPELARARPARARRRASRRRRVCDRIAATGALDETRAARGGAGRRRRRTRSRGDVGAELERRARRRRRPRSSTATRSAAKGTAGPIGPAAGGGVIAGGSSLEVFGEDVVLDQRLEKRSISSSMLAWIRRLRSSTRLSVPRSSSSSKRSTVSWSNTPVCEPLAVRAAQGDLPAAPVDLAPLDRVDELRVAVGAEVQLLRSARRFGLGGLVVEVDDLDRLAARQRDALDPLALLSRSSPALHLYARTYRPAVGKL